MPVSKEIHQQILEDVQQEMVVLQKGLNFLENCCKIAKLVQEQALEIQ